MAPSSHSTTPPARPVPPLTPDPQSRNASSRELAPLVKRGVASKAQRGDWPGLAPLGYLNITQGSRKSIAVDDARAPLVRQAFELAQDGDTPLGSILSTVTEGGLATRQGKPLGMSALLKMLANPFYTGKFLYRDELLRGNHQAIVDSELFERVQTVVRSQATRQAKSGVTR